MAFCGFRMEDGEERLRKGDGSNGETLKQHIKSPLILPLSSLENLISKDLVSF